ncbi:MAG: hypothetical protein ACTSXV_01040, partial [Alphaproteobacteria bacterium]
MFRFVLFIFIGISMLSVEGFAQRRSTDRSQTSERRTTTRSSRNTAKQNARRGRGTARTAVLSGIPSSSEVVSESEIAEVVETDLLQQKVDAIKKVDNAWISCMKRFCTMGTGSVLSDDEDAEEFGLAMCSDDLKKFKGREEGIREKENNVRILMREMTRVKLNSDERAVFDSLELSEKEEIAEEDKEMDFDSLMDDIDDLSDSMTRSKSKKLQGEVLLRKAGNACQNSLSEIENFEDRIDLFRVRVQNAVSLLEKKYADKEYKLEVAYDTAKMKLGKAAVEIHSDLLDGPECLAKMHESGESMFGENYVNIGQCDNLTGGCADKNLAQLRNSKSSFSVSSLCKNPEKMWAIYLTQVERTLERQEIDEIYTSKEDAIVRLASVQRTCLDSYAACIEDLCGGEEAGNVMCISGRPYGEEKNNHFSLYKAKKTNTAEVKSIFTQFADEYGIRLSHVSEKQAEQVCQVKIEACGKQFDLLAENPDISKQMLESDIDEDILFEQAYAIIQNKADKEWMMGSQKKLLREHVKVLKAQLNTKFAKLNAEYSAEEKKLERKANFEKEKVKQGMREVYGKKILFYQNICFELGGKYTDSGNETGGARCLFEVVGRQTKNKTSDASISISENLSANMKCEQGIFAKKPKKGCTFTNGRTIDYLFNNKNGG